MSDIIDNVVIPVIIKVDRRKGVDPADKGALHSIICKLLGIEIDAKSDSVHKAELEAMNGRAHPFITTYAAMNNIKTIKELNTHKGKIVHDFNKLQNKNQKISNKHLRQASEEKKEILRNEIKQVYVKSEDGFSFNKKVYEAYDENGKINLQRYTWSIISIRNKIPKFVWNW